MNFKNLIISIELLSIIYNLIIFKLNNIYINKPLPKEVKDIYDKDRYRTFINYRKDKRKISIFSNIYKKTLAFLV